MKTFILGLVLGASIISIIFGLLIDYKLVKTVMCQK